MDLNNIEKEIEKLNVPSDEQLKQVFKKIHQLDMKVNVLLSLVGILLVDKKPLSQQVAEKMTEEFAQSHRARILQDLILKWG